MMMAGGETSSAQQAYDMLIGRNKGDEFRGQPPSRGPAPTIRGFRRLSERFGPLFLSAPPHILYSRSRQFLVTHDMHRRGQRFEAAATIEGDIASAGAAIAKAPSALPGSRPQIATRANRLIRRRVSHFPATFAE